MGGKPSVPKPPPPPQLKFGFICMRDTACTTQVNPQIIFDSTVPVNCPLDQYRTTPYHEQYLADCNNQREMLAKCWEAGGKAVAQYEYCNGGYKPVLSQVRSNCNTLVEESGRIGQRPGKHTAACDRNGKPIDPESLKPKLKPAASKPGGRPRGRPVRTIRGRPRDLDDNLQAHDNDDGIVPYAVDGDGDAAADAADVDVQLGGPAADFEGAAADDLDASAAAVFGAEAALDTDGGPLHAHALL
eukprot:tig00021759_g23424.t1